jgi:hypothetical protein
MALSESSKQHIAELVATWPPLTEETRAKLARVLNDPDCALGASAPPSIERESNGDL